MILHRWHVVNGCVEWLTFHVNRYVGPVVRGLPSLGPCTRAAAVGLPLLGVPGSAFTPSQGGFYFPAGWGAWFAPSLPYEYAAGSEASPLPPAGSFLSPFSRGEGLLAVPGTIVSEYVPSSQIVSPLIPSVPVERVDIPPSTNVPEPSSIVLAGVGAGAAILVRRRRG
jgi:hypothetical protein